ncbi:MAG: hypothetical protein NVSMB23_11160 [Myxococcales bacterium]
MNPSPFRSSPISTTVAIENLVSRFESGLLVSDEANVVCFANPAMAALMGISSMRLIGLTRATVLSHLRTRAGAAEKTVQRIVDAEPGVPGEIKFIVERPERRVLAWKGRPLELAEPTGRARRAQRRDRRMAIPDLPGVTLSAGVAQFDPKSSVDLLLDEAAERLADAQQLGGDRVA